MAPEYDASLRNLLAAFWNSVRDDLHSRGVTTDDGLPYGVRRKPYRERVTIERKSLRVKAGEFLSSPDFVWWSDLCGLDPDILKENLITDGDYI